MNLILFDPGELGVPLARTDPRALHLLEVLRRKVGDSFDAGEINGARGKGILTACGERELTFEFRRISESPLLDPIILIVGLPRPQTARKILQDCATLGVRGVRFFRAEKGESGYAQSTLWSSGEWRRHLIAGAAQAFDTRLPEISHDVTLGEALMKLPPADCRIALDNYESPSGMSAAVSPDPDSIVLAFGPERGWSASERDLLRAEGFTLAHLGLRVLRTETAVVAAVSLIRARLGRF